MKVVTWNQCYWQHRFASDEAWDYLMKQIGPDLALLQEVSPTSLDKNEYFAFRKVHQNWGTALYTRNMPLEELVIAEEYPGRVTAASFEITPNRKAIAVSVHASIIEGYVFLHLDKIFDEIERMYVEKPSSLEETSTLHDSPKKSGQDMGTAISLRDFPRAYSLIAIRPCLAERNKPSFEKEANTRSKMTICSSVMI